MPETVYVVTTGEYSDYGIERICSTRARAEAICAHLNAGDDGRVLDYADIEEWQVDGDGPTDWWPFIVTANTATDRVVATTTLADARPVRYEVSRVWVDGQSVRAGMLDGVVLAHDREHAIKIASEQRRALIQWWDLQPEAHDA